MAMVMVMVISICDGGTEKTRTNVFGQNRARGHLNRDIPHRQQRERGEGQIALPSHKKREPHTANRLASLFCVCVAEKSTTNLNRNFDPHHRRMADNIHNSNIGQKNDALTSIVLTYPVWVVLALLLTWLLYKLAIRWLNSLSRKSSDPIRDPKTVEVLDDEMRHARLLQMNRFGEESKQQNEKRKALHQQREEARLQELQRRIDEVKGFANVGPGRRLGRASDASPLSPD